LGLTEGAVDDLASLWTTGLKNIRQNTPLITDRKDARMIHKLGHVTILVNDFDQALDFYLNKLDFVKRQDQTMPNGYRWLTVAPKDQREIAVVFVLADSEAKKQRVGSQVANHVFLTLVTDDCLRDYKVYKSRGIKFYGEPKTMPYGTEVIFEDLHGNRFDLVQINPVVAN
jgi:predicted enzyme related to lactoylglutathione lyase